MPCIPDEFPLKVSQALGTTAGVHHCAEADSIVIAKLPFHARHITHCHCLLCPSATQSTLCIPTIEEPFHRSDFRENPNEHFPLLDNETSLTYPAPQHASVSTFDALGTQGSSHPRTWKKSLRCRQATSAFGSLDRLTPRIHESCPHLNRQGSSTLHPLLDHVTGTLPRTSRTSERSAFKA